MPRASRPPSRRSRAQSEDQSGVELTLEELPDDDPDLVAAKKALEGVDEDKQARTRALICRAISSWSFQHTARAFVSWLGMLKMQSKSSVSKRVQHVLTVEPRNRTRPELELIKNWLRAKHAFYFAAVDPAAMDIVARAVSLRRLGRKEVLFMQGQEGRHWYLILSGQIAICAHPDPNVADKRLTDYKNIRRASDGGPLNREYLDGFCGSQIRVMHKGSALGEMALFTNASRRSASAVGKLAGTEVLEMEKWRRWR